MKEAPYFVWRRSDGYINSTRYKPNDTKVDTFEHLGTFDTWPEAAALIAAEVSKATKARK